MKIVFLRHLPTLNNLNSLFIGRLDLECEKSYIKEHAEELKKISTELYGTVDIYCSPLKRAKQTAALVFPKRNIILDERLIERDLGSWSDVPKSEIRAQYPAAFFSNGRLNFTYTPNGGEPFELLIKRVASFLLDVGYRYNDDDTVVAITHNGVITTVKCIMKKNFNDASDFSFQPYLEPYAIEFNMDIIKYINNIVEGRINVKN